MENSTNRHFYKCEGNDYPKNKKNYIRFLCRITDENIIILKALEEFKNIHTCKKACNSVARDRAELYNFNTIPYDNSQAKDYTANHFCIVSTKEHKEELTLLLKDTFGDDITFRNRGNVMTTQIGDRPTQRGTWETDKQDKIIYPICIVSFGRHNKYGKTHLYLTKCKIKHYLFVQPNEIDLYSKWYDPTYCELVMSKENFSSTQKMGSTPMRNYILEYVKCELKKNMCWILDDNIKRYLRYYQGAKNEIQSHSIFSHVEQYIKQYDNVGLVSHNFNPFIMEGDCRTCLVKNGKCYSSMLVWTNKDIKFRYKHQEDNLISMEYINKGYCNLCFNSVMYDKETSGKDKGGNATDIYKVKEGQTDGDGYRERYEYFECILKILHMEDKLKLIEGKTINDLLKRSTTMLSKEYHAKLEYSVLVGNDNELVKRPNIIHEDNTIYTLK
jgi:hypothetical protein